MDEHDAEVEARTRIRTSLTERKVPHHRDRAMNLTNIVQALDTILTAYRGINEIIEETQRVRDMIDAAQQEGRDLSDDEVEDVRKRTDDAIEHARSQL